MTDIRLDWETYNVDQNDGKLLDFVVVFGDAFPLKDADGNEVLSSALRLSSFNETAWEKTRTTVSEETSASLQSLTVSIYWTPWCRCLKILPHILWENLINAHFLLWMARPSFPVLISGCGRGRIYVWRWAWGRRGDLSLSLSWKEKTHICPHQASHGQSLRLPLLHHTATNSTVGGF